MYIVLLTYGRVSGDGGRNVRGESSMLPICCTGEVWRICDFVARERGLENLRFCPYCCIGGKGVGSGVMFVEGFGEYLISHILLLVDAAAHLLIRRLKYYHSTHQYNFAM